MKALLCLFLAKTIAGTDKKNNHLSNRQVRHAVSLENCWKDCLGMEAAPSLVLRMAYKGSQKAEIKLLLLPKDFRISEVAVTAGKLYPTLRSCHLSLVSPLTPFAYQQLEKQIFLICIWGSSYPLSLAMTRRTLSFFSARKFYFAYTTERLQERSDLGAV